MTGCKDSNTALPVGEMDARVGPFVPAVESLLRRITSTEPTISYDQDTGARLTGGLAFPDGIGEGEIVGELFTYRDTVRLDVHVEHNRTFAGPDGSPTERRCYLNDYVASVTLDADSEQLPPEFVRNVVAGVAAARDAVRRHNRRAVVPWNGLRIAAREETADLLT